LQDLPAGFLRETYLPFRITVPIDNNGSHPQYQILSSNQSRWDGEITQHAWERSSYSVLVINPEETSTNTQTRA
jgi:hypothetical protein